MGAWQQLIKFKILRVHDLAIPILDVDQQGSEYKNVQFQYFNNKSYFPSFLVFVIYWCITNLFQNLVDKISILLQSWILWISDLERERLEQQSLLYVAWDLSWKDLKAGSQKSSGSIFYSHV